MGVGKGSVAREVIKLSDYVSVDTDDLIESMENKTVKKIFADSGEEYFRSLEKKVSHWLEKSIKNTLISTGGGFYKQKNLKNIGVVVFLDSSFDKIVERINSHPNAVKKIKKRPLLEDLKKARELYNERLPQYKALADVVIDVTDKSALECAKELLSKVKKHG